MRCRAEHGVVCRATGPASWDWLGGRLGGLTDLTAPGLPSYCAVAFDGLAGQAWAR